MHIQFEATVDELIEVQERMTARSRVARSWRLEGAAVTALLGGLIAGTVLFAFAGGSVAAKLIGASVAAIVAAVLAWHSHRNTVKRRLRTYIREKFGDRSSFPFELELTESGIWTKQITTQSISEWANVEEITETEDSIDIYMRDGGGIVVRKRAFGSPGEQQQFLGLARRHLALSRSSSGWRHRS